MTNPLKMAPFLMNSFIRCLATIILTHADWDLAEPRTTRVTMEPEPDRKVHDLFLSSNKLKR